MEKDYSLLRPFDLEAAKRGEKFAFIGVDLEPREFVAGPDSIGTIIIKDDTGRFQSSGNYPYVMLPLAWVEGRPVYRGDVLYSTYFNQVVTIVGPHVSPYNGSEYLATDTAPGANSSVASLTWQKPKTKREGWVNIYRFNDTALFADKKTADKNAISDRIDCVRIEWEE